MVLEHVDIEVTVVSNININTREYFEHLRFKTSYSLYLDLFNNIGLMLLTHDNFLSILEGLFL